jgi:hypothetical protein
MQSSRGSLTFQRPAASGALLLLASCILLASCFAYLIPKIETVCSSETSVNFTSLHGVISQLLVTTMRLLDLTRTFLIATMFRMAARSTQCSLLWVQGTGHSPQPTVKIENLLNLASTPPIHLHGVTQCYLY